jgi:hypothetical protein
MSINRPPSIVKPKSVTAKLVEAVVAREEEGTAQSMSERFPPLPKKADTSKNTSHFDKMSLSVPGGKRLLFTGASQPFTAPSYTGVDQIVMDDDNEQITGAVQSKVLKEDVTTVMEDDIVSSPKKVEEEAPKPSVKLNPQSTSIKNVRALVMEVDDDDEGIVLVLNPSDRFQTTSSRHALTDVDVTLLDPASKAHLTSMIEDDASLVANADHAQIYVCGVSSKIFNKHLLSTLGPSFAGAKIDETHKLRAMAIGVWFGHDDPRNKSRVEPSICGTPQRADLLAVIEGFLQTLQYKTVTLFTDSAAVNLNMLEKAVNGKWLEPTKMEHQDLWLHLWDLMASRQSQQKQPVSIELLKNGSTRGVMPSYGKQGASELANIALDEFRRTLDSQFGVFSTSSASKKPKKPVKKTGASRVKK